MIILDDGEFRRVSSLEEWREVRDRVVSVWDNGEILMGFGEFLENNKNLVPSAYNRDWWAADLQDSVDHPQKVSDFAGIMATDIDQLPKGLPFNGAINREARTLLRENGGSENGIYF